jgi:TrmH RNA methyltransferase
LHAGSAIASCNDALHAQGAAVIIAAPASKVFAMNSPWKPRRDRPSPPPGTDESHRERSVHVPAGDATARGGRMPPGSAERSESRRERAGRRPAGTHPSQRERATRGADAGHTPSQARAAQTHDAEVAPQSRRHEELRIYGLNAVRAVFARRPDAIRKVYLAESRIPALQPLLRWCVAHRVGYRVVDEPDLQKLAASAHHEGVVADVLRAEPMPLSTWLRTLPDGPLCALWLDGVGNPHNFGAILRSAAHFGVAAVLLPKDSPLALSGAAARVAEGGAEAVPLVRLGRSDNAIAQLRGAGFALAATLVEGGRDPFRERLPERLVHVLGAEGEGMDRSLASSCDLQLSIPGTGAVESLNVATATAVLLAAWRARTER